MFRDTGRGAESGQLCRVGRLFIGPIIARSIFHEISWSTLRARRLKIFIGVAETLAGREYIDIGKTIAKIYELIINMKISLIIAVDCKDIFHMHST